MEIILHFRLLILNEGSDSMIQTIKPETDKKEYVRMDNMRDTENHLLNILWDRNKAMKLDELTAAVNSEFAVNRNKKEIRCFLQRLIKSDYVEKERRGLKVYYKALG